MLRRLRPSSAKTKKMKSTRALMAIIPGLALLSTLATSGSAEASLVHNTRAHSPVRKDATSTLVALGDSITFGYNLGDNKAPSPLAFPFLVGKTENLQVQDLGVPGWTSTDMLKALNTDTYQTAIKQASVITLDIGSNDLLHLAGPLLKQVTSTGPITITPEEMAQFTSAIEGFGQNLPQIIASIRKLTAAPIVLVNLYDPIPDISGIHPITEQLIAKENAIITQVAAQTGSNLVDAYSIFNHRQLALVRVLQADVHPTVMGQAAMAAAVDAAIEKPLWYRPVFFATAPSGTVVYAQPDTGSAAVYTLHGIEGDLVTGTQDGWLQVTTGNQQSGYVPMDKVNLLLRPTATETFRSANSPVKMGTITSNKGTSSRAFEQGGVVYAPVSFLAKSAGAKVSWDNAGREVNVSSPFGTMASAGAAGVKSGRTAGSGSAAGGSAASGGSGSAVGSSGTGASQGIQLGTTLKFHIGTKAQKANLRTEGILVSVDGEAAALTHEAVVMNGTIYVPAKDFAPVLGGVATTFSGGLQLLFVTGS